MKAPCLDPSGCSEGVGARCAMSVAARTSGCSDGGGARCAVATPTATSEGAAPSGGPLPATPPVSCKGDAVIIPGAVSMASSCKSASRRSRLAAPGICAGASDLVDGISKLA